MNDRELQHVVDSLASWSGAPVTGAWQPRRDRVLVGLGDRYLLLVPRGPWARLHSVASRPSNPARPYSFQGALRAHLLGHLVEVVKDPGDRVVDLRFDSGCRLHLRLTGRSGGLWLIVGDRVLAAHDGPARVDLPPLVKTPPRRDESRFTPRDLEDWDQAARRWFTAAERQTTTEDRRIRLSKDLKRALDRAERLQVNLEEDLRRADEAPALRRQADTLAAHLHELRRGADQVSLPDLEDPGRLLWIKLDPGLTPAQNMEASYARARRLDRVGDNVLERLDQLAGELAGLRAALADVPTATDEELASFERLAPRGGERPRPDDPARPWTTWTGPRGERVLVGKNAQSNRKLTFQTARGDDFWMHVRERPGAHLLIPCPRDRPPPLDLLLAAAQIALAHAKAPIGGRMDVQYTRARHVRPIPGEVARVRVDEERVLHVVRDPAALGGWTHD